MLIVYAVQPTESNKKEYASTQLAESKTKRSAPILAQVATSEAIDSPQNNLVKSLWQQSKTRPETEQSLAEEISIEHIKVAAEAFNNLTVGQQVSLYIPQENKDYLGTVTENYQQFEGKVEISSGELVNASQFSSFTVTQGAESTLVMIATNESIYQVEINNASGYGTVIDDRELDHYRQHDDSLHTPPEGIS